MRKRILFLALALLPMLARADEAFFVKNGFQFLFYFDDLNPNAPGTYSIFAGYSGELGGNVAIPGTAVGFPYGYYTYAAGVTSIWFSALQNQTGLTGVTIPGGVGSIW